MLKVDLGSILNSILIIPLFCEVGTITSKDLKLAEHVHFEMYSYQSIWGKIFQICNLNPTTNETSTQNTLSVMWFANCSSSFLEFLLIFSLITPMSYLTYFGIGGFLHVHYYINQRKTPENWKCQPTKWLPNHLELEAIYLGSFNILLGSIVASAFTWHIIYGDGSYSKMYFDPGQFGWIWLLIQTPVIFLSMDYLMYWHHRLHHTAWMYKTFHKMHHVFKQPTPFAVTAFHPVEFLTMQLIHIIPVMVIPTYWVNMLIIYIYVYVYGMLDHSGIKLRSQWWQPWQPDVMFHDDHHQFTRFNFGFNTEWWDWLHNTKGKK